MTSPDPEFRQEPTLDPIAPAPQAPTPSADPVPGGARLTELEAKHAEVSDAYLRAKAQAGNPRRRAQEENSKAGRVAVESVAGGLLPVRDSLEAATAIENASTEQLLQGVHGTLKQLTQALERNRVTEINPP